MSQVAARIGDGVVLWRGPDLRGRDIDVLAMPGAEEALAELLIAAGLAASRRPDGRTVWSAAGRGAPVVDVMPARSWPVYYPGLPGVVARASRTQGLPLVASPEDRLLMLAAEVVAGRSIDKSLPRAGRLLEEPRVRKRLAEVAETEGLTGLAELISHPERIERPRRKDRLGYRAAASVALRCPAARSALGTRLRARLARLARMPAADGRRRARPSRRGLVIAISGMDGAGKSTAASVIQGHLEQAGVAATIGWGRLGARMGLLHSIAPRIKRLLGRQGTVADSVAAGSPLAPQRQEAAERQGRRRPVSWIWILLVAAANARYLRRVVRARRSGTSVVCDRWVVDSLVDLELRYGGHRAAEWVLSRAAPHPHLGILLHIDAATAHARQPGDQAPQVLEDMERRYDDVARRHGFIPIDASAPLEDVEAALRRVVVALLAQAGLGASLPGPRREGAGPVAAAPAGEDRE